MPGRLLKTFFSLEMTLTSLKRCPLNDSLPLFWIPAYAVPYGVDMWAVFTFLSFSASVAVHLACVAAVPFLFQANKRAKTGRAKEHAWGEQKIGEKWGGGEREEGGGGVNRPLPSARYFLHSLPRKFFFALNSSFVPSRKFLETPATQATIHLNVAVSDHCKISNINAQSY